MRTNPDSNPVNIAQFQASVHFVQHALHLQSPDGVNRKVFKVAAEALEEMGKVQGRREESQDFMERLRTSARRLFKTPDGLSEVREILSAYIKEEKMRSNPAVKTYLAGLRNLEVPIDDFVAEVIAEDSDYRKDPTILIGIYKDMKPLMSDNFGHLLVLKLCEYDDAQTAILALVNLVLSESLKNQAKRGEKSHHQMLAKKIIDKRNRLPNKTEEFIRKTLGEVDFTAIRKMNEEKAVKRLTTRLSKEMAWRLYVHFIVEQSLKGASI